MCSFKMKQNFGTSKIIPVFGDIFSDVVVFKVSVDTLITCLYNDIIIKNKKNSITITVKFHLDFYWFDVNYDNYTFFL